MKKKPIIAIAAIRYFDLHHEHNLEKIKTFIGKAKKMGADIVCFPENCITKEERLLLDHHFIKEIRKECKRHSIWCIVTEDVKFGEHFYTTAMLVGRDGKVKGHYEKINLYGDDTKAGNEVRVFETDFAKVGIVICWDLTFPGLFSEMKKKGAEIVFCPAKWYYDLPSHKHSHKKKEIQLLRSMLLARAHENVFYVALSNPIIEEADQVSYSAIADPHDILKELIDKEGIITAEADVGMIRKFRKYYGKK
ncbi:carbon-nitrogen hydrolase family protein [Candidatus Peregrinibacteria bacterium]|nr:carbon-nitrogen hydrolase family protein [Candidatus Peregrinibacteria bacterium]